MLSSRITTFKTGDYTVTRTAAPTYTDGLVVAGSTSTFSIAAAVVPLQGADLKLLPEGLHVTNTKKVMTVTELLAGPVPDSVSIGGEAWAVFHVEGPWTLRGSTHYNVFVARQVIP